MDRPLFAKLVGTVVALAWVVVRGLVVQLFRLPLEVVVVPSRLSGLIVLWIVANGRSAVFGFRYGCPCWPLLANNRQRKTGYQRCWLIVALFAQVAFLSEASFYALMMYNVYYRMISRVRVGSKFYDVMRHALQGKQHFFYQNSAN